MVKKPRAHDRAEHTVVSCNRPAKIIIMAKAPVAAVKGRAAGVAVQCHCGSVRGALATTPQA
jgi:hypothetical protein